MIKKSINKQTIIKRKSNQIFSEIENEVVMLNVKNAEYYYLISIGSYIWHYFSSPKKVQGLIENLEETYEASPDVIVEDINSFLIELVEKELLQIVHEQ